MIRKNGAVKKIDVDPNQQNFRYLRGLYIVSKTSVLFSNKINIKHGVTTEKEEPFPELIYSEGNPVPITSAEDTSTTLDNTIIENAIEQTAETKGMGLELVLDYIKHPSKALIGFFTLIIIGIVTYSLATGGL